MSAEGMTGSTHAAVGPFFRKSGAIAEHFRDPLYEEVLALSKALVRYLEDERYLEGQGVKRRCEVLKITFDGLMQAALAERERMHAAMTASYVVEGEAQALDRAYEAYKDACKEYSRLGSPLYCESARQRGLKVMVEAHEAWLTLCVEVAGKRKQSSESGQKEAA